MGDEISGASFKIFEYVDEMINECFNIDDFTSCNMLLEEIDLAKCSDGIIFLIASAFVSDKDKVETYKNFFTKIKNKIVNPSTDIEEILSGLQP
jgi:hypothetical protein